MPRIERGARIADSARSGLMVDGPWPAIISVGSGRGHFHRRLELRERLVDPASGVRGGPGADRTRCGPGPWIWRRSSRWPGRTG